MDAKENFETFLSGGDVWIDLYLPFISALASHKGDSIHFFEGFKHDIKYL